MDTGNLAPLGARIVRLDHSIEGHTAWYGYFEKRCVDFIARFEKIKPDIPYMLSEMMLRWLQQPAFCGYYLAFDGDIAIGHLASWIAKNGGHNRCYIWQAWMDAPSALLKPMIGELRSWLAHVNGQLPEGERVAHFEWVTWHPAAVYERYLRSELEIVQTNTILTALV